MIKLLFKKKTAKQFYVSNFRQFAFPNSAIILLGNKLTYLLEIDSLIDGMRYFHRMLTTYCDKGVNNLKNSSLSKFLSTGHNLIIRRIQFFFPFSGIQSLISTKRTVAT